MEQPRTRNHEIFLSRRNKEKILQRGVKIHWDIRTLFLFSKGTELKKNDAVAFLINPAAPATISERDGRLLLRFVRGKVRYALLSDGL